MSCDPDCLTGAVQQILIILTAILGKTFPQQDAIIIVGAITASVNTILCELPANIQGQVVSLVSQLSDISTNTVKNNNITYIVTIFLTLLLLVIFNFLSKFIPGYDILFFILSLITVIAGAVILFFVLNSINSSAINQSTVVLNELAILLSQIQTALGDGVRCFGQIGNTNCAKCCKSC